LATDTLEESPYFCHLDSNGCLDEEIITVLRKISINDVMAKNRVKKEAKKYFGLNIKDFSKLWRKAHPADELDSIECDESLGEILFQYRIGEKKSIRMRHNGIYVTKNEKDENGDIYISEEHIIFWTNFKVTGRYLVTFGFSDGTTEQKEGYHQEWHYNIILNNNTHFDQTESTVKGLLSQFFTSDHGKDYLTSVLHQALTDPKFSPDISHLFRDIIGFTDKGWQLPDKYFFPIYDDISKQIYVKLKHVLSRKYNHDQLVERIRNFYIHTGIEHKDILFAWSTYAPFGMAIRDKLGLMVMADMTGIGDMGKSPMAYEITGHFYGHCEANLGHSISQSYSLLQSWMSSSTFPIVFDDCEDIIPEVTNQLKTYTCQKDYMSKKGGGPTKQFYTVYKQYCADVCMTNNKDPIAFADPFFRERSIYAVITELKVDPLWFASREAIEHGDYLLLLYEYTKDWTVKNLIDIMQSFDVEGLTDERNKKIIRFIKLGAYLFEKIIGIKLDISKIKQMILVNNEIYTLEMVEALRTLLRIGKIPLGKWFKPAAWVTTPLRKARFESVDGVLIDLENIRDLQMIVEGNTTHKWTYQIFYQKICPKIFPKALNNKLVYAETQEADESNNPTIIKVKSRGIFVPNDDLIIIQTPNDANPDKKSDGPMLSKETINNMLNEKVPVESLGKLPTEW